MKTLPEKIDIVNSDFLDSLAELRFRFNALIDYLTPEDRCIHDVHGGTDCFKCYLEKEDWTPKEYESYFFIDDCGETAYSTWTNHPNDTCRKSFLGIFKSREEAEKRLEEIKRPIKQ